jgi:hypothetical protein
MLPRLLFRSSLGRRRDDRDELSELSAVSLRRRRPRADIRHSRTLFSSDDGATLVFSSGSGITLTVPAGLGAGFGCVIVQNGAGQVTPTAAGVTIASRQSYTKTAGQYAVMSLLAVAADTFILFGDGA